MSYYVYGGELSYPDYLTARSFCRDITSATGEASRRVSIEISRQTRDLIASNEELSREQIRVIEASAAQVGGALNEGFSQLSYDIKAGISELNATFHWGFGQMLASMGRMNDSLTELIKIAKTPAQNAAYEQYEIARDAFRQGLYLEGLESLDKAISGDHTTSGYKLEWRFHQMKGVIKLGFAGSDLSLVDLATAEASFTLAARYAKADYPEHAAQAFLSAGWAAYCQGRMAEGLAYTEEALAINHNFGEALFQAAKVRMALGKFDAALPVLGKAINIDRLFVLKAAGDGDFQRHDEKLRVFLEAMRIEKYQQSAPKVREALKPIRKISAFWTEGAEKESIRHLEAFLRDGASWPLMDVLSCVQRLQEVIAEARRTPIGVRVGEPGTFEETWQEEEAFQEEVVVKPGGLFSGSTRIRVGHFLH